MKEKDFPCETYSPWVRAEGEFVRRREGKRGKTLEEAIVELFSKLILKSKTTSPQIALQITFFQPLKTELRGEL